MLLNDQQVTEEIKWEIKKILETNYNENMTIQNLWYAAKAVLKGKFIAIQFYLKKQDKHQIDKLTLNIKQLDKEEPPKPSKFIEGNKSKIQAEINEKEMKATILKINITKSWSLEKINEIDKPFSRLFKNKKESNQQN